MNQGDSQGAVLVDAGAGRCAVKGDLTLATVGRLWRDLETTGLLRSATCVDLGQVGKSDSAGLALLVAWRAGCRAGGGALAVTSLPARMAALAGLTGAETIVSG